MVIAEYRGDADAGRAPEPALLAGKERASGQGEAGVRALESARVAKFVVVSPGVLGDGALLNLYSR
jgi:hypothetical protein